MGWAIQRKPLLKFKWAGQNDREAVKPLDYFF